MLTSGYHSRFYFPHRRMRVEFTLEVPLEGDVVLEDWIVSKSEVCEGEDIVDGERNGRPRSIAGAQVSGSPSAPR